MAGHPLDEHIPEWGVGGIKTYFSWRVASENAFKKVPVETASGGPGKPRSSASPTAEYQLEILERGRFLQKEDTIRIAGDRRSGVHSVEQARDRNAEFPYGGDEQGSDLHDRLVSLLPSRRRRCSTTRASLMTRSTQATVPCGAEMIQRRARPSFACRSSSATATLAVR